MSGTAIGMGALRALDTSMTADRSGAVSCASTGTGAAARAVAARGVDVSLSLARRVPWI